MKRKVSRGIRALCVLPAVAVPLSLSSGCALNNLREQNERLRESNARLVSENNRLESELAQARSDVAPQPFVERPVSPPPVEEAPEREEVAALEPAPLDGNMFPDLGGESPEVIRSPDGIIFRFPDRVFFGLGQSKLSKQGQRVLERMADLLKTKYANQVVRVDGHTDDIPIQKLRHLYPSNWELSTARACTVVRYLVETAGIAPQRIYPAGFAYYRPLAAGATDQSRSRNRRVEITVLDQS